MHEWSGCRNSLRSPSRITSILAGSLGVALYSILSTSSAHAAPEQLSLEVSCELQDCLVSVSAQPAPLSDVMRELAARTGLEIHIDPSVSYDVTQHFEHVPLESAIQRLVGPHATLLVFEAGEDMRRLRKVHVMTSAPVRSALAAENESSPPQLDGYGRAWLAAHHDSDPRFLTAASIKAALSWQNYLARLPEVQRTSLHERMLEARAARAQARQLAASAMSRGVASP
ncbi:MAG: hypothetical protein OET44_17295 [Gammaproteobacteria bacterium]|nr:hypothetical protein [Gammaproteobacteria bacterium]